MAKRLVDSAKFTDPWYRRLPTAYKLLWDWMLCNCDHAGILVLDLEYVELLLNEKFSEKEVEKQFGNRLHKLSDHKFFIPKFIKFQYGELNPDSRVHKSVIKKLLEIGVDPKGIDTLSIPYVNSTHTVKDKEKAMDKVTALSSSSKEGGALKIDTVIQLFNDTLADKVGRIKHCHGLSGPELMKFAETSGFKQFSTLEAWKNIFAKVESSSFLNGTAPGSTFKATLNWLVIHTNALKVLNGQYDQAPGLKIIPGQSSQSEQRVSSMTAEEIEEARALGIFG